MFRHLLVPTDGTALSLNAVRKAVEFAHAVHARITFLHAKPGYPVASYSTGGLMESITPTQFDELTEGRARKFLEEAEDVARSAGVACTTLSVTDNSPDEAIIRAAGESGCDLIFMASHGRRGMAAVLLGSETQKVLTHSTIPVLVFR